MTESRFPSHISLNLYFLVCTHISAPIYGCAGTPICLPKRMHVIWLDFPIPSLNPLQASRSFPNDLLSLYLAAGFLLLSVRNAPLFYSFGLTRHTLKLELAIIWMSCIRTYAHNSYGEEPYEAMQMSGDKNPADI